jgi:phosphate transport system ATP-binding protein
MKKKADLDNLVEQSLRKAALWEETKDRLHKSAFALSSGQQQRLCIARSVALKPDIIILPNHQETSDYISGRFG